jgi:hypothetical protein
MKDGARLTLLLCVLLSAAVFRLWLLPLPSSFWVDEMVTAFVVHYGSAHPSLAVAPQVTASIYYAIPRTAEHLFGFSEIVYRLPSTVLMAIALLLVALLAARLIHPNAAWFIVFGCLSLRLINYEAGDARPYALGTAVSAAALWFLVRWLDRARWLDAILFLIAAAALWRVHLVYWPFYLVFAVYSGFRIMRRDSEVSWARALLVYALLGAALSPVVLSALALFREAGKHVIVDHPPAVRDLSRALKFGIAAGPFAAALIMAAIRKWPRQSGISVSTSALALSWWLIHPLSLFVFSRLTGSTVFVDRYLSLSLPGAAFAGTAALAFLLPPEYWKAAAAALGAGVVLLMGNLRDLTPRHHNSDWRAASQAIRALHLPPATPIVYPSPFIEAKPPAWKPGYPVESFFYCHTLIYPAGGTPYRFPFETSPEAESYAASVAGAALARAGRFLIYGGNRNVDFWEGWFAARPELAGWRYRRLGKFGDVEVSFFENPASNSRAGTASASANPAEQLAPTGRAEVRGAPAGAPGDRRAPGASTAHAASDVR